MCNPLLVGASELVEINIGASTTGQTFKFPQNLEIIERNSEILCVEAYSADEIPVSPLGKTVVSNTVAKSAFIALRRAGSGEYAYNNVPVQDLIVAKNNGQKELMEPQRIDFSQSEIRIPAGTVLVANTSFLFRVIYRKPSKC